MVQNHAYKASRRHIQCIVHSFTGTGLLKMTSGDKIGLSWKKNLYYLSDALDDESEEILKQTNLCHRTLNRSERLVEVSSYTADIENAPTWMRMASVDIYSHSFAVFKTASGYFYSLEKGGHGLHLQRGTSKEEVVNQSGGFARANVSIARGPYRRNMKTLGDVLDFIKSELDNAYLLVGKNCHKLASNFLWALALEEHREFENEATAKAYNVSLSGGV